jgi:hypothetical protein
VGVVVVAVMVMVVADGGGLDIANILAEVLDVAMAVGVMVMMAAAALEVTLSGIDTSTRHILFISIVNIFLLGE